VDLIFVDANMKINGAYYREMLLTQKLMPVMLEKLRSVERSSSSSKAMLLLTKRARNDTPTFISPNLLPPNITDLNPVCYKIREKCSSGSSKFMTLMNRSSA